MEIIQNENELENTALYQIPNETQIHIHTIKRLFTMSDHTNILTNHEYSQNNTFNITN